MLELSCLFLLVEIILVKCLTPDLHVQQLDRELIQRKRQDTLEMCQIFNTETAKLNEIYDAAKPFLVDSPKLANGRRIKRSLDEKKKIERRVESIVGQMYDDLDGGDVVDYRKRDVGLDVKELKNNSRRFFFAPRLLLEGDDNSTHGGEGGDKPYPVDWPKKWKHGIVPYFIDPKTYDSFLFEIIVKAFDYIERATCIRLQKLREKPIDSNSLQKVEWLYITNPSGIRQCVHSNEYKPNIGVQMVVFGYDCMSQGEIVHEIMHVLGFSHEHTRPDRDSFITVLWDNIKPGYKKYFELRPADMLMNLPYDFASVLHYPQRAFSKNGKLTLLTEAGVKIGQRQGLSETDVEKIGIVFGHECLARNKQYLLKTCPTVVSVQNEKPENINPDDIKKYFKERLWPFGIVNFRLRDRIEFSLEERENIKAVMEHIERETCIEFRDLTHEAEKDSEEAATTTTTQAPTETTTDENKEKLIEHLNDENEVSNLRYRQRRAVSLPTRRHASSILTLTRSAEPECKCPEPGRPEGDQVLQINADCFNSVNDLLHLFVHVLGLDHQHNSHDRDSYIHILWESIDLTPELKEEMSTKLPPEASVGYPYDYQSVMHFPWLQIKNGVTNIMYPIWNDGWAMGHWQGLSSTDVLKLNYLYKDQCEERKAQANTKFERH